MSTEQTQDLEAAVACLEADRGVKVEDISYPLASPQRICLARPSLTPERPWLHAPKR